MRRRGLAARAGCLAGDYPVWQRHLLTVGGWPVWQRHPLTAGGWSVWQRHLLTAAGTRRRNKKKTPRSLAAAIASFPRHSFKFPEAWRWFSFFFFSFISSFFSLSLSLSPVSLCARSFTLWMRNLSPLLHLNWISKMATSVTSRSTRLIFPSTYWA